MVIRLVERFSYVTITFQSAYTTRFVRGHNSNSRKRRVHYVFNIVAARYETILTFIFRVKFSLAFAIKIVRNKEKSIRYNFFYFIYSTNAP